MGFKSAKNTRNVKQNNGKYEVDDIIFPSRLVFSTIESIDRNLRFLYSPPPPNKPRSRINYSEVRDDEEEFNCILDRVEERIKILDEESARLYDEFVRFDGGYERIDKEGKIVEKEEDAFINKFSGLINFLYEADDFKCDNEDELSKKKPRRYQEEIYLSCENIAFTGNLSTFGLSLITLFVIRPTVIESQKNKIKRKKCI